MSTKKAPVKQAVTTQATTTVRDSRGFVPSYAGGRVRRIHATE